MPIREGQEAPDFTLYSNEKEPFTLSERRGQNVLLLFFPGAFTSVCTDELTAVNNDAAQYPGTQIVGISTDSPFVLDEFRSANGLGYPLLSDHDGEVSALYGAKYDGDFTDMGLSRIAKRAAFLIDKEGAVRYAEVLENAGKVPDFDRIQAALRDLDGAAADGAS